MSDQERPDDETDVPSDQPIGASDMDISGGDDPVYDEDESDASGVATSDEFEDVGPGSEDFEERADELMDPVSIPQPALPGDFKENWTLFFCAVSLFAAAMWLPMEGHVIDLTAKDSVAGGFLLVAAGCAVFGCWANIAWRKMLMKPILLAGFIGLYVAAKRLFLLFSRRYPEMKEAAGDAGVTKDEYLRLVGSGTWVILFFSLLIFWTLFQSVRQGRKRHIERQETERAAKTAARKNR